jgi:hypothetical protein
MASAFYDPTRTERDALVRRRRILFVPSWRSWSFTECLISSLTLSSRMKTTHSATFNMQRTILLPASRENDGDEFGIDDSELIGR